MKKPVLVIMAAGMGSRYGGLKQIDPVDKEGHIIIDFSIYDAIRAGFEEIKTSAASLMSASEITIQSTKDGIGEDAVSVVVTDAVVYLPLAELVDFEQEIERLTKEEERLKKELARVNGMLSNEKFISKAPEAKINEEKAKLEKYTQMMEQVR